MVQEYKPGKWLFKHNCSDSLKHNEGPYDSRQEAEEALIVHQTKCAKEREQ